MSDSADVEAAVRSALRDVPDPELGISIVALGLVRGVRCRDGAVEVDLTYTSLGCPWTEFIRDAVTERLADVPGVRSVLARDVWEETWTPNDLTPRAVEAIRGRGLA